MEPDSGATLSDDELRAVLRFDQAEVLERALDAGLDPRGWLNLDSYDAFLTVAIDSQSVGCVRLLLARNGDWCLGALFDPDWVPPLAVAVELGSDKILRLFLDFGLVERYPIDWLRVALQTIPIRSSFGLATLELLEKSCQREEGLQALVGSHSVRKTLAKKAIQQSKVEKDQSVALRWSELGERLQVGGNDLKTLISQVEELVGNGQYRGMNDLLDSLPPSLYPEVAGTALITLVPRDQWQLVEELIAKGADCTIQDSSGDTALMFAALRSNLKVIRLLIENGADVTARQKYSSQSRAIDFAQTPLIRRYLEKEAAKQPD